MPAPEVLSITRVRTFAYRVPARPSSKSRPTNIAVVISAQGPNGDNFSGVGEGQPRSWRTGDDAGDSMNFVSESVKGLPGRTLRIEETATAIAQVRAIMSEVAEVAIRKSEDAGHKHPFRGSMLGIEVALLDLVATARGEALVQLLGHRQETAPRLGSALSIKTEPDRLRDSLRRHLHSEDYSRITGVGDPGTDLRFLERVAGINHELGRHDKPLLLDLDGALDRRNASSYVQEIVTASVDGRLPAEVIIEQPVPVKYSDYLGTLQREASEALEKAGRSDLVVRISGDESVWDVHSLSRLNKVGGVKAINIRPARAGGLLAGFDLAERAVHNDPNIRVFVSRMNGCSRLTSRPLENLALALPKIDGAIVAPVVESDMAMSRLKPEDSAIDVTTAAPGTTLAPALEGPVKTFRARRASGHGVELILAGLISEVENAAIFPEAPAPKYKEIPVTKYNDVDDLHPLGPNGSKGHLLEREALALGLNTTRYSKGAFTATDGKHEPVPFKWSRNPLSSAAALALCTHKEATRMQLQQAGVPVPQGRTFARGDYSTAREFAQRIGYPVVVKPSMGVRGIGVVANIQDEAQLDDAFELMSGSKLGHQDFIVEKHVKGSDYRIVVIGNEVIAAIQREPSSVFGDGRSTIGELLVNKNVARRRNPHLWARPAKYDDAARHELRKAGRDLDTVLAEGEQQLLANTCSLSQGGDSIDVLDEMHPSIREASVAAVKAMPGLFFCGVDFLLEDHTKPLDEQDAGICELNAHAAIGNCEYPMFGTGRPVAETMMRATVDHFGFTAHAERAERLAIHLTIRGRVTGVGYRDWLKRRAGVSGIEGWVRNIDNRTVEAVIVGDTDPVTAVAAATILGPRRAVPTAYEATQIPIPAGLNGFEIRENAPKGTPVEAIDAK
ncbi:acylphosphatase [Brevibacterium aurantiacum]|uniref:acylphosphatase n=1 Tax=Brevibacterium aurantiacum TaxID=273384 RepID=A0A2H1J273_BREAU|nr:acylphosphatase [Brevibacterium aurantiacum]SMX81540.1 D-alanine-D-alanine ligase [Brevibacterium aurantiacum]